MEVAEEFDIETMLVVMQVKKDEEETQELLTAVERMRDLEKDPDEWQKVIRQNAKC